MNDNQSNDAINPVTFALSPDERTLAYTQPFSPWIYIYDIPTKQVIGKILTNVRISFMVWIPVQLAQALVHLPTLTPPPPTVTPSMKLSLKPVCLPAARNSLNQDVWQWEVINPNPVAVTYSLDWYDIGTKTIVTGKTVVPPAQNGIPSSTGSYTWTQPGPNKVHLYVDGMLQDEQTVPPLPCPGSTAIPLPLQLPTPISTQ